MKGLIKIMVMWLGLGLVMWGAPALPDPSGPHLHLNMIHKHTNERVNVVYKRDGEYVPEALEKINWLLRDVTTDEVVEIDVNLLEVLTRIQYHYGLSRPLIVLSGFRSKDTNDNIRRAAANSFHVKGQAIDFTISGVGTRDLGATARRLSRGGVGMYSNKGFIHVDTGRRRSW